MTVGLVLVSHSAALAAGVAELARQMAPDIVIAAAGGDESGGLGTSFDIINNAIEKAAGAEGAVVLYDLGSALLTTETVLEFLEPEMAERIRVVDAPLVEGAVAAAVTAQGGAALAAVEAAAAGAGGAAPATESPISEAPSTSRLVDVVNENGLHARPVAALARAVDGLHAEVRIGRPGGAAIPLGNVLRVVALAVRGGEQIEVSASGSDAAGAARVVAEMIATGFGEAEHHGPRISAIGMGAIPARLGNASGRVARGHGIQNGELQAQPGSPGLAVGPLVLLDRAPLHLPELAQAGDGAEDQQTQLTAAIGRARRKLASGNEFEVAHAALVTDPELLAAATERVQSGTSAAQAWWSTISERADELAAEPDELVASRAVDLREAGGVVLDQLGVSVDRIPLHLEGGIVLADDLGPGEIPVLVERGAHGVVLTRSSPTAHAVIVARGLGLPMVLRAGDELSRRPDGTLLILDGSAGTVVVDPPEDRLTQARAEVTARAAAAHDRLARAAEPVVLPDGRPLHVMANIGSIADARKAVASGADGVGLLRTELLLLDRDVYPDEATQIDDLRAIFDVLGDRPIVVRVLDAGGDKPVTALNLDEKRNGFLGVRGLRYLLAHPDLLRSQLRAIARAAVGHHVSVMAPMVTVAAEALAFREAVAEAMASLVADQLVFTSPEQIGVMIEVPAAALAADEICQVADFLSVGTNDLTSYTMAADRTDPAVADLLDPHATALGRLLDQLCAQAAAAKTPVAICGEVAGMPDLIPGLIARGVTELSVAPVLIPTVKQQLRELAGGEKSTGA